jgi:hypothetical protein
MHDKVYLVLRHLYGGMECEPFVFVSKKAADDWEKRNERYWKGCTPWYEHVGYRKPKER